MSQLFNVVVEKYGPPPPKMVTAVTIMYGPELPRPLGFFLSFLDVISTPVVVIASFIIGIVLYLLTHRKVFLFIPLIPATLYFIRILIDYFYP